MSISSFLKIFILHFFSDSCLQSLHEINIDHPILYIFQQITEKDKIVNFCLIPVRIVSNYKDLNYLKKCYTKIFQILWDFCDESKLYSIKKVN